MKTFTLLLLTLIFTVDIKAQSNPQVLDSKISITRIMTVRNGVIRMAKDPVSHNIFYILTSGQIYEVFQPGVGAPYDSLVDSTAHHSVDYVQGMVFHDSTLYVSGNNHSDSSKTAGIIVRGKLQPNGSRVWDTLMITQYYQTADYFDHLFSGIVVSPAGDSIYICSGARGDHGEIQTRYGAYPGLRNVPLTTNIYALPTHNASPIVLPNDSTLLAASGYVFCRGVRNHFDMGFDKDGNLFGLENSGDRDHNEEMNWLQRNHHYGFPWKMGDTDNPQQFPSFVPANDKLINHYSRSWRQGFWNNDPAFPHHPPAQVFDNPIQNFGPDCDKYRDSTGAVHDASDASASIGSFTAHRSPLGLVFDNAQVMDVPYRGDGFMLSWTKGYDSCGCTTVPDTGMGPFVDPSQDLVHLDLSFDSLAGNFRMNATRIIAEFDHPVDADIDSNIIYVIENGYGGTSGLFAVEMPGPLPCNPGIVRGIPNICQPDTNYATVRSFGTLPNDYYWYNESGTLLRSDTGLSVADTIFNLPSGNYYVVINDSGVCGIDTIAFSFPDSLYLHVDSVSHTTCIGCTDGIIYFTITGGSPPYNVIASGGTQSGNTFINLAAGNYQVCAVDGSGCAECDSGIVLEDPTMISTLSEDADVRIYPNPVSHVTTLKFNGDGNTSIRLLDENGKLVRTILNEHLKKGFHEISIDCSGLAKGIYTLEILDSNKKNNKKLVLIN